MRTEVLNVENTPKFMWKVSIPSRPLSGLTVLIVEDSRYSSEAMRLLCLRSGARIRRADSLASAQRHLGTYRPEVVIIDLGLPDGDGAELISTLDKSNLRIPVILGISGDSDLRDTAIEAGADGFLAKPIESLAIFQQTILQAFPTNSRGWGLAVVPDELIQPDSAALRADFSHVVKTLANLNSDESLDYIARFLAGVARSVGDEKLETAATELARCESEGIVPASEVARISEMVEERLIRTANS